MKSSSEVSRCERRKLSIDLNVCQRGDSSNAVYTSITDMRRRIADAYWQIHRQPRTAWTQELDLRPFKESF
jgi:hypothetical protein